MVKVKVKLSLCFF